MSDKRKGQGIMRRISEQVKIDTCIWPAAVSSNGTTSAYFKMTDFNKALFVWTVVLHSAGLTTTSTGTVYQAKDGSANTSAAGLADSTAILTASAKLCSLTVTSGLTVTDGDTVSLIEQDCFGDAKAAIVYTMTSCGTSSATISNGINISTAAGTGQMSTTVTFLAAAINGQSNSALYGSATTTTLVIRSRDAGETVFGFTASNTTSMTIVSATVQGMIEIGAGNLTTSSNFTHCALGVVNESAYMTSAIVLRDAPARYMPRQQAAVFTVV
jgi:hypothetical protein